MNNIYLVGSDEVARAGSSMQGAASDILRASSNLSDSVDRLERVLENFLQELKTILEAHTLDEVSK